MTRPTWTLPVKCKTVKRAYQYVLNALCYLLLLWAISGWVTMFGILVFFTDGTGRGTYPTTGLWAFILAFFLIGGTLVGTTLVLAFYNEGYSRITNPINKAFSCIGYIAIWVYNHIPRLECIRDDDKGGV